ncbi:MAG: hypothetical protein MUP52_08495 [Candidatus Aminicenantes bacterium]|nr:hypothetical protein [Candidatus Aminicenantes bacterium]
MSTVKFMIASLVLLVPLCAVLFSAEGEETKATVEKRSSFIVLPVIYYSPETRWAGGVGGIWSFRPGKARRRAVRRSSRLWLSIRRTDNSCST